MTATASGKLGVLSRFAPTTPLTESAIVGVVSGAIMLAISRLDITVFNNYVLLAEAFLHGHVWIDWPGPRIDALQYGGAYYIIEGPLPAILMLPFVYFLGERANETAFTCVCAGVALGTAWYIGRGILGTRRDNVALLVAFFAFGTDLAWCSMYGAVWFTAHVVADMFLFFALAEAMGRKRPWMVLLMLLFAASSRFAVVLAIVPLVPYALSYVPRAKLLRAVGACAAVAVPFAAAWVWYNYARWGVWNDIGYTAWYHQDQIGEPTGSPFRLAYVPYELQAFFADFPTIVRQYPWVTIGYSSVPLTVTSPGLLIALFARGNWRLVLALWVATVLIFVPNVMYYANGGSQFGMRHALDFEPFMLVLMMLAIAGRKLPQIAVDLLCGVSILVGIWGIWYWRTFYDEMLSRHLAG